MRAGRLRHKITIQQNTPSQDTFGQPIESWSTYSQPYADVQYLSGGEKSASEQDIAIGMVKFTIRYQSGINERMRISYDSRVFDIHHINHIYERYRTIELTCQEINNNG